MLANFFWAACRPHFFDFNPLKEGEMLVNFFFGVFFGRLPIGIAHFNTPEGGKRSSIFLLAACRPQFLWFLTPKTRGNAREFFVGLFFVPFGSKIDLSDAKLD